MQHAAAAVLHPSTQPGAREGQPSPHRCHLPPTHCPPHFPPPPLQDFLAPELQKAGYTAIYKKKTTELYTRRYARPAVRGAGGRWGVGGACRAEPGLAWPGLAWPGLAWPGLARAAVVPDRPTDRPTDRVPCPLTPPLPLGARSAYAIDGCATFFRRERFALVKKYEVRRPRFL